MPGSLSAGEVQVMSRTWAHSTHDLYDFEAVNSEVSSNVFSLSMTATFHREKSGEVKMATPDTDLPPASQSLAMLLMRRGRYFIDRVRQSNGIEEEEPHRPQRLWLVVRDLGLFGSAEQGGNGLTLQENDVLKLGRSRFRVRQLVTKQPEILEGQVSDEHRERLRCQTLLRLDEFCGTAPKHSAHAPEEATCRICLFEGTDPEDPLISPCSCKGSISWVHLNCCKYWIKSKLDEAQDDCGSFFYQPIACELCKTNFPMRVKQGTPSEWIISGMERWRKSGTGVEQILDLVETPTPEPPYIVLEGSARHSSKKDRGFHILSLADGKEVKLGRSHDCHVSMNDVSISRCQARIKFEQGQFVLQDNGSKFGTLVAMRRPCLLEPGKTVSIQAGRTVLSLRLAPPVTKQSSGAAAATPFAVCGAASAAAAAAAELGEQESVVEAPTAVLSTNTGCSGIAADVGDSDDSQRASPRDSTNTDASAPCDL